MRPPYADTQSNLDTPNAVPAKKKRITSKKRDEKTQEETKNEEFTYVDSGLLHRRLGHRSIPVLMNASKNQLWKDTRMTLLRDGFCDNCKIVTA